MRKGKSPFEKNSQIKLVITFNLNYFSRRGSLTLMSIHGESHMITGWSEPTKEKSISYVCVILNSM